MEKRICYIIFGTVIITGLLFTSGCDKKANYDTGFLKGIISIGPICPVVTYPPVSDCMPTAETYKAFPVSIWTSDGKRKIAQIDPALDGSFTKELNPGNYLIVLEKEQNTIGSSNLPLEVSVISNDSTFLNIDIDTGIR